MHGTAQSVDATQVHGSIRREDSQMTGNDGSVKGTAHKTSSRTGTHAAPRRTCTSSAAASPATTAAAPHELPAGSDTALATPPAAAASAATAPNVA
eukprot:365910-Chlamydomonas_euryale.AAC.30